MTYMRGRLVEVVAEFLLYSDVSEYISMNCFLR
jgi:hypothetical protein